jgi:hypothetical protein
MLLRPEEATERYQQGDPFLHEALDHGERLYG